MSRKEKAMQDMEESSRRMKEYALQHKFKPLTQEQIEKLAEMEKEFGGVFCGNINDMKKES